MMTVREAFTLTLDVVNEVDTLYTLTEREQEARDLVNAFYLLKIVGNGAYDPEPETGEKS